MGSNAVRGRSTARKPGVPRVWWVAIKTADAPKKIMPIAYQCKYMAAPA